MIQIQQQLNYKFPGSKVITLEATCLWPGDKVLDARPIALSSISRIDFSCCRCDCSCSICKNVTERGHRLIFLIQKRSYRNLSGRWKTYILFQWRSMAWYWVLANRTKGITMWTSNSTTPSWRRRCLVHGSTAQFSQNFMKNTNFRGND